MSLPSLLAEGRVSTLVRLVVWGLLQAAVLVATALLIKRIFDILFMEYPESLAPLAIQLVVLSFMLAGLRILARTDTERLGQQYVASVRTLLFSRLLALDQRRRQQRRIGHLMLRFVTDLNALRSWISQGLAQLIVSGLTLGTTLAVLAVLNTRLALAVAVIVLLALGTLLLLGPALSRRIRLSRQQRARLAADLGETLCSAGTVQVCGRQRSARSRLRQRNDALLGALLSRTRLSATVRQIPEIAAGLTLATVVVIGLDELAAGATTPGTLVAILTIIGLLTRPLSALARLFDYWQQYRLAHDKIANFLTLPVLDSTDSREHLRATRGHVEFRDLAVAGSLRGISVSAPPGSLVVIVGPNGAGKSTLLALAARLIAPDRGRVLIDGQDLAYCSRESITRSIGIVSNELPLVRGSIEYNLRYRLPKADAAEIEAVCRWTGLDAVLRELPKGLRTRLGEKGHGVAAGIRQRIALARALLGGPAVLLLDEVDAELDGTGRRLLDRLLRERPATVLLVTHDPARVHQADLIWHLDNGTLVEQGPPDMVLKREGPTARLFGLTHRQAILMPEYLLGHALACPEAMSRAESTAPLSE